MKSNNKPKKKRNFLLLVLKNGNVTLRIRFTCCNKFEEGRGALNLLNCTRMVYDSPAEGGGGDKKAPTLLPSWD